MISALFGLALGWLNDTIQTRDLSGDSAVVWFGAGVVLFLVLTAGALYGATVVASTPGTSHHLRLARGAVLVAWYLVFDRGRSCNRVR